MFEKKKILNDESLERTLLENNNIKNIYSRKNNCYTDDSFIKNDEYKNLCEGIMKDYHLKNIKELKTFDEVLEDTSPHHKIQEDDVMTLINTLMANTKSENIENTSGDPFWEKSEMIFLQSLFYYVIRHYDKRHQNFTEILKLIRLSNPDATGVSELDRLFNKWAKQEPDAIRCQTI